jgi:hypothetical protein
MACHASSSTVSVVLILPPARMGPLVNGHLQAAPGFPGWQEELDFAKRAPGTRQPRGETKKIIFRSARPRSRARMFAAAAGAR